MSMCTHTFNTFTAQEVFFFVLQGMELAYACSSSLSVFNSAKQEEEEELEDAGGTRAGDIRRGSDIDGTRSDSKLMAWLLPASGRLVWVGSGRGRSAKS